jgi:hypothetical protein
MTRNSLLIAAVATAALATGGGTSTAHDDDDRDRGRRLKADLRGFQEVPAVSSPGRGSWSARISRDEKQLEWRLSYRGLQAPITQSHIHFGDHHTNGGISLFLCTNLSNGPAGTQTCPVPLPGETVTITGTAVAADVFPGAVNQGIAAGEFAELIRALRAGIAYANVHTTQFGGGEIRGQVKVDD